MEAKIILIYNDPREAEAIATAVSPDNIKVPTYLFIETFKSDKEVITYVRCEENKFGTFISTIDDLLSCISIAEKALSSIIKKAI